MILDQYGRPRRWTSARRELLARMRGSDRRRRAAGEAEHGPSRRPSVEDYILDELTRGTADIRGANAADAKALRVARNLLAIFKPRLTGVVLQQADVAHGSFNGYAEVIRQNDAAIGELWKAVQGRRGSCARRHRLHRAARVRARQRPERAPRPRPRRRLRRPELRVDRVLGARLQARQRREARTCARSTCARPYVLACSGRRAPTRAASVLPRLLG